MLVDASIHDEVVGSQVAITGLTADQAYRNHRDLAVIEDRKRRNAQCPMSNVLGQAESLPQSSKLPARDTGG